MEVLPREEYIEQAYLFKALQGRLTTNEPVQEILVQIREEVLSTTKLPMAIDFLLAEVRHVGTCLLYTSPSPRDGLLSRMPSSA